MSATTLTLTLIFAMVLSCCEAFCPVGIPFSHPISFRANFQRPMCQNLLTKILMQIPQTATRQKDFGRVEKVKDDLFPQSIERHSSYARDMIIEGQKDFRLPVGLAAAFALLLFGAISEGNMTYLKLHVFLIIPELWMRFTPQQPLSWASNKVKEIGYSSVLPLCLAAIVFSSLWDNFIFSQGVFTFDKGSMIGTIGAMPVEEWIWFVDHTTMSSMVTLSLLSPLTNQELDQHLSQTRSAGLREFALTAACLATCAAGIACMLGASGSDQHWLLLGVCAAFMPPVLALQWWFGLDLFLLRPREWVLPWALVSTYVLGLDRWAQGESIWRLSPAYITGADLAPGLAGGASGGGDVLGLGLEAGLIYSLTTALVVQTVIFAVRAAEAYQALAARGCLRGRLLPDLLRAVGRRPPSWAWLRGLLGEVEGGGGDASVGGG